MTESGDDLGARIEYARKARAMTSEALAGAAGISKGQLSEIENGKKSPTVRTLRKIANGLRMPPGDLL